MTAFLLVGLEIAGSAVAAKTISADPSVSSSTLSSASRPFAKSSAASAAASPAASSAESSAASSTASPAASPIASSAASSTASPARSSAAHLRLAQRQAQPEQFVMDGKVVPKSFYDASSLMSEGLALLHQNRNQEASAKLKQAVAIAPDFAEAHHNYGLALARSGQLAPAEKQFHLALSLNPNLDGSWLSLGGLYQSTGRVEEAISTYRQFVERFPNSRDTPKVSSLIEGLEKVQAAKAAAGAVVLPPPVGDDYLAEVDSDGLNRWQPSRFPLKVYIGDGAGVPGYSAAYATILKTSFQDWAKCSRGLISFVFVKEKSKADIECSWLADSSKLSNSAESGETRLYSTKKLGIVHGTIKLLTMPILPGQRVTDNSVRMMCLHEIGHVLGLTGHTTDPDDTMFYSSTITARWTNLTQRDANTIIRLYSPLPETAPTAANPPN